MASKKRRIIAQTLANSVEAGDVITSDSPTRGSRKHDLASFVRTNSPALTGAPTVPTPPEGDATQRIANTVWVATEIARLIGSVPGALDTLQEIADALGDDPNFAATMTAALANRLEKSANLSDLQNVVTAKTNLGIERVNNTTDAEKPVSAQTAAALALKAPLASPVLTGTPTAPTPGDNDNSTKLATTAYVKSVTATMGDVNAATAAALALKAPLASPALTGSPTAPTATLGTANTQLATTGFVAQAIAALLSGAPGALDTLAEIAAALGNDANLAATLTNALALKAPLASPSLSGAPTAPTASPGTNTDQLATTAYVLAAIAVAGALKAPLASPVLTGTPLAPTAAPGTATTQIATTGFVATAIAALLDGAPGALDTLNELAAALSDDANFAASVTAALSNKVDKVVGKQLSTEDFSTAEKSKLAGVAAGATANASDAALRDRASHTGLQAQNTVTNLVSDLADKAPIASPALTGAPTAPTPATEDSSTKLATTAYVAAKIAALLSSAPGALDTLAELAAALGEDPNFATTITNALALKAPLASPSLSGTPTAPTAAPGTNTAQLATTAYVVAALANLIDSAPGALDTLNELAAALGDDPNFAATLTAALALKAPLASPGLTGTPTAPTPAPGTNTTQLATTAFVVAALAAIAGTATWGSISGTLSAQTDLAAALALKAPLASPALTGTPTVPTAAPGTNTTQAASTAFVAAALAALLDSSPAALDTLNELAAALGDDPNFAATIAASIGLKAPLASPAFTGTPTVPTAAPGTSTTQAASTAFVAAGLATKAGESFNLSANSTGNTTFTHVAKSGEHLEVTNVTGSAGTRVFILDDSNGPATGARFKHRVNLPATAGIIIEWRLGSAGGALVLRLETDDSGSPAVFDLYFDGADFAPLALSYPANPV